MRAWQEGQLSNFDYLIYLNLAAGRSFCDLTQWPVMPWLLKDYKSETLDLKNPDVFRDLSKPIGALNADRLAVYKERYTQMKEGGPEPAFLYGTHYSTPGYVLYWLVRTAPAHMLRLQNGRFDAPDRLFVSIMDSWESVMNNAADLKELIPEFFTHPGDFLVMREGLNLGIRQGGEPVGDVKLPPWAKSPNDFITKHQEALECEHVSKNLHMWIDLIFGSKQRGEPALAADNLFHHLTYEGSVNLEEITDPVQRASLEAQINEFGQAPRQLFTEPHPPRLTGHTRPSKFLRNSDGIVYKQVFQCVNPMFLSRIMTLISAQDNPTGHSLKSTELRSPISPSVSTDTQTAGFATASRMNKNSEDVNETQRLLSEALKSQEKVEGENSKHIFMRLASARTSEEQRHSAMANPEYCNWDNWSPASTPGTDLQNNVWTTSTEGVNLQQDCGISKLAVRRVGTETLSLVPESLATDLLREDSDSFPIVLYNEERGTEGRSPWPWMSREHLSKSQSLRLHRGPVNGVLLSEENASECLTLYSAGQDGFIKVYSIEEGSQIRATKLGNLPLSALALAGSCDKYPIVLAGSYDNCLYAYSVDYGRALGKIRVHEETVSCVKIIDHSFQRLITASWDATVKIWTMEEGRGGWSTGFGIGPMNSENACVPEGQFLEHDGAVLSLDVEQNGYLVVSGEEDGTILAWDLRNPTSLSWQQCGIVKGPATGIRLIADGTKLVVSSGEGKVHMLDVRKGGTLLATYDCKTSLKCIEATNDVILAGSANGGLHFFPVDFQRQGNGIGPDGDMSNLYCSPLQEHEGAINSISVSSNRNRLAASLATASADGCIQLYNVRTVIT